MMMKISELVFKTLNGDGVVTGRDEGGLYLKYDSMRVRLGDRHVVLIFRGEEVARLDTNNVLREGDEICVSLLDGRMRITLTC